MKAKWKRPMYWATVSPYSVTSGMLSKGIRRWKKTSFAERMLSMMIVMVNAAKKSSSPQPQVKWTKTMTALPRTRIAVFIRTPTEAHYRLLNVTTNLPFLRIIDQASLKLHQIQQWDYHSTHLANTGPHFRPMFGLTVSKLVCKRTQPRNELPTTSARVHQARFINSPIFGGHFERMNSFQYFQSPFFGQIYIYIYQNKLLTHIIGLYVAWGLG